jgi:chorismate mutase
MNELDALRTKIDEIDDEILTLIIKRLEIVKNIGKIKNKTSLPIKDLTRENEKINSLANFAKKHKINKKYLEAIWKILFKISYEIEKKD